MSELSQDRPQGKSTDPLIWIVSAAGNLTARLSGLLSGLVLARVLGPTGRGIAAEAVLWPTALLTIGGIINFQTVTYFTSRFGRQGAQTCLFLSVVLTAVLLPMAWGVNWIALGAPGKPSLTSANIYACVIPFWLITGVFSAALLSEGRIAAFWTSRGLPGLLGLVGTLLVAGLAKLTPAAYTTAAVIGAFIALVVSALMQRTTPMSLSVPDWPTAKAVLKYGTASSLVFGVSQLNFRLDQLLMSLLKPESSLGKYAVAVSWASTSSVIGVGIGAVVLAQSSRVPLTDAAAMQVMARKLRLTALYVIGGGAAAAIAAAFAVPLLFGSDFRSSVEPAVILSIGLVPYYFSAALHEYARGLGFPLLGLFPELTGLLVNLVLQSLLLPPFGGVGAAVASLVSYSVVAAIMLRQIGRHVPGMRATDLLPRAADLRQVQLSSIQFISALRAAAAGTPAGPPTE